MHVSPPRSEHRGKAWLNKINKIYHFTAIRFNDILANFPEKRIITTIRASINRNLLTEREDYEVDVLLISQVAYVLVHSGVGRHCGECLHGDIFSLLCVTLKCIGGEVRLYLVVAICSSCLASSCTMVCKFHQLDNKDMNRIFLRWIGSLNEVSSSCVGAYKDSKLCFKSYAWYASMFIMSGTLDGLVNEG